MLINGVMRFTRSEIDAIKASKEYVDANFNKSITISDLAEKYAIGSKKLHTGFRKYTGQRLHYYILGVRLAQSKLLLENLEESIKQIHKKIGYKTQSHFSQFFKKQTGITPSEYRSQFYQ